MNETTIVVEAIRNVSDPIKGTTVRSSPTIPPTNAFTSTSRENCCQFSRRPSEMRVTQSVRWETGIVPSRYEIDQPALLALSAFACGGGGGISASIKLTKGSSS